MATTGVALVLFSLAANAGQPPRIHHPYIDCIYPACAETWEIFWVRGLNQWASQPEFSYEEALTSTPNRVMRYDNNVAVEYMGLLTQSGAGDLISGLNANGCEVDDSNGIACTTARSGNHPAPTRRDAGRRGSRFANCTLPGCLETWEVAWSRAGSDWIIESAFSYEAADSLIPNRIMREGGGTAVEYMGTLTELGAEELVGELNGNGCTVDDSNNINCSTPRLRSKR